MDDLGIGVIVLRANGGVAVGEAEGGRAVAVSELSLEQLLQAEFGIQFEDWRTRLPDLKIPDVAPEGYPRRDLAAITAISVHHAAADLTVRPETIHRFHQSTKGPNAPLPSPGIAYHIYLFQEQISGKSRWIVAYTGDIATVRWHTASNNGYTFGICAGGNYDKQPPPWEVVNLLQRCIAVVKTFLGRPLDVKRHRGFLNTSTSCPGKLGEGDVWLAVLQTPVPKPPVIKWDKVCWYLEQAMRNLEFESYKAESDQIGKTYLADAVKHRDG